MQGKDCSCEPICPTKARWTDGLTCETGYLPKSSIKPKPSLDLSRYIVPEALNDLWASDVTVPTGPATILFQYTVPRGKTVLIAGGNFSYWMTVAAATVALAFSVERPLGTTIRVLYEHLRGVVALNAGFDAVMGFRSVLFDGEILVARGFITGVGASMQVAAALSGWQYCKGVWPGA